MKKLSIVVIMLSLLSFSIPQKTQAVYVDLPNFVKEYGLDSVAYQVAAITLKKMTAKTVNWINSGFKGNPGYIQNPRQFFLDLGDEYASGFLSQAGINQICAPFNAQVRLALVKNYIDEPVSNYSCTIDILRTNYDNFTRDFSQGGWDSWFEITQNEQNNPYGAYIQARNRLSMEITARQQQQQKDLDLSGGFLNFKRCPRGASVPDPVSLQPICTVEEETVTPGTIINDQLQRSLGSSWDRFNAADEFNEIVTALITQLIEQLAGSASGLFGASERSPTGSVFTNNLRDETQPIVNYPITVTDPSINCRSTGGTGGSGGSDTDGDGIPDSGGTGGTGGTSGCTSSPGSIRGLPPWPLGGGAGSAGSCEPYVPDPSVDCTRVTSGGVLGILNNYRPSNNGIRAAEPEVRAAFGGVILDHPVRLDKFDFGNGMVVDVIGGAIGNANGSEDDEGTGWVWNVECACNRDPAGYSHPSPAAPLPQPGVTTYTVTFTVSGFGTISDGTDSYTSTSLTPTTITKTYPANSRQSITAEAAIGYTFVGWGGACASFLDRATCSGPVTGNGAVSATFR